MLMEVLRRRPWWGELSQWCLAKWMIPSAPIKAQQCGSLNPESHPDAKTMTCWAVTIWMPSCSLLSGGRATDARDTDHKMELNWPTWQFQTLKANHFYFPLTQRRWWCGTVGAFRVMILLRRLFGEWALTGESLGQAVGIVDFSQGNMFVRQLIP